MCLNDHSKGEGLFDKKWLEFSVCFDIWLFLDKILEIEIWLGFFEWLVCF